MNAAAEISSTRRKNAPRFFGPEDFTAADREWIEHNIERSSEAGACWIWQGSVQANGYGRVAAGGRGLLAHRAVYTLHAGSIPEGLQLDHLCGRKDCVNPSHLEPVTNMENSRRRLFVKLDAERVREIRALKASGLLQKEIAARFGMSEKQISRIVRGEQWADVAPKAAKVSRRSTSCTGRRAA